MRSRYGSTIPLSGGSVTIFHYFNNVRYNATKHTNSHGKIILTRTFDSAGPHAYYATFAGDSPYETSTSAVVNVNVGSNQSSSQATTNIGSVAQTTTALSASAATPQSANPSPSPPPSQAGRSCTEITTAKSCLALLDEINKRNLFFTHRTN